MIQVVDTHAHLDQVSDPEKSINDALEAGVSSVVGVGSNYTSNKKILAIAEANRGVVHPAIGIHPWDAPDAQEDALEHIESHAKYCVAVGEIGLDYWIKKDVERQKAIFKRQLEFSRVIDKPVIVHSRGAWEDCFAMVGESEVQSGVFHWYSGPLDVLDRIVRAGYLISVTPAVAYSKHLRAAAAHVPLSSLLLETDSPVRYKGKETSPADVLKTLSAVSELLAVEPSEVAEATTTNARRLFSI